MPVSEVVSVSEVMTLSDSMSESVSEVPKNIVSVSESASNTDSDTNSCPKSCPCPFISDSNLEPPIFSISILSKPMLMLFTGYPAVIFT